MAKKAKKVWSNDDYAAEAREFVACYGRGYCWEEFVYEYINTWDSPSLRAPDADLLLSAIRTAEREAV